MNDIPSSETDDAKNLMSDESQEKSDQPEPGSTDPSNEANVTVPGMASVPLPDDYATRRRRKWSRIGIILLGFILAPIAAFICGFCCCFAGISVGGNGEGMIIGFVVGTIFGLGFTIYLIIKWLKHVSRGNS